MHLIRSLEDKVILVKDILNILLLPELQNLIIHLFIEHYFADPCYIITAELNRVMADLNKGSINITCRETHRQCLYYYNKKEFTMNFDISGYQRDVHMKMMRGNSGIICDHMRYDNMQLRLIIGNDGSIVSSNKRHIKLCKYSYTTTPNKLNYIHEYDHEDMIYPLLKK